MRLVEPDAVQQLCAARVVSQRVELRVVAGVDQSRIANAQRLSEPAQGGTGRSRMGKPVLDDGQANQPQVGGRLCYVSPSGARWLVSCNWNA
jgi:hypothetical protein